MDIYSIGIKVDSRQVKQGQKDLNQFGQTAKTTENTTAKLGRTLAKLSGAVGGLAILRQSITTMMDFNKAISGVQAVTGAAGAEIEAMEAKARKLGATTQFSATQAANAFEFLGMAGFSASQSIESIGSVLDLAAASGMDLARSADIASNVLSGFQLEAEEAGRMADVLAKGASSANTNVEQLGNAMQFVAPVAATLGISVEESTAAIGALSNAGIQGQKAGTGLRRVLVQLIKPTSQAQQALSKYGLSLEEVDPSVRNFTDILQTLRDRNISAADSAIIFGAEGVSAYQALAGQISGIRSLNDELNRADGAALDMASQRTDNLAGDLQDLSSAFGELQIALLGDEVDSALRSTTQVATALTRVLGENADAIKTVAQVGATLVAMRLSGWAYGAVGGLAGLQAAAKGAATGLTTAAGAARGLRGALAFLGGPAGLLVGVGSLALSFAGNADEASESTTDWADEVDRLAGNLENLERRRIQSKLLEAEEAASQASRLRAEIATLENGLESNAVSFQHREEAIRDEIAALKEDLENVNAASEAAIQYRLRLEELNNQQNENTESTENQTTATKDQAKSFEELRASVDPAFAAALDYRDTIHELKEQLDAGNITNQQYVDLVDKAAQSMNVFGEESEDAADKATDAADEIQKEFDRVANSIESEFSDAFYDIFDDGIDAFGDLADGILDIFRRTLADMAAAAIRQQIVIPITQQIVGGAGDILGIAGGGGSGLPGLGGGSLLSGNAIGQTFQGVGNMAFVPGVSSTAAISGAQANAMGAAAPSGLGGSSFNPFGNAAQVSNLGFAAAGIGGNILGGEIGGELGGTLGSVGSSIGMAMGGPVGAIAGSVLGGIAGSLFGGDDPDPSTVEAAISAAGDVDVSVRKGDAISREQANKLESTFGRTLNQYTDSLDQAIENTIDSSLEEQIGDDGITTRKINKIVERYIGGDEGSIQKGISRVMEEVTRSLTFIIPQDIHEATSRLDQEADNYGEQVMAITNAFAMSNGDLVGELRHFIDNTEATGQQFVDQLSQFSQQLQERERQIAQRTRDLSTQLLQSFGRTAELVKAQLIGMTSENAALQIALNLRENIAEAEQAVASAEQEVVDAYQREISALESRKAVFQENIDTANDLAETYKGLTETLRNSADELLGVGIGEQTASRAIFQQTLNAALRGNLEAFEELPGLATDLSQAVRSQAGTLAEARRANARIANQLEKAADRAESESLELLSEKEIAERSLERLDQQIEQQNKQIEKLTEQALTLQETKAGLAKAEATLKTAQDASTQAINSIGELLPDNIVNGLMEPLSPLEQIDASTKAMVDLLGNLRSGTIVDESGTGVTTRPGVGAEPDDPGKSTREIVEDAYSDILGLSGEFEDSQERMSYWGDKLNRGELSQDNFREQFVREARVQGNLTDEQFRRNQEFLEANPPPEFADGGVARGPMSGFPATLHGTEAVIPMNGQRIPLEVNNQEMIQELRELRQEVNQLRTEQGQSQYQITKNTKRTKETLEQFDIEGLPPERSAT